MQLPYIDKLATRSRRRLASSAEGSILESEEVQGRWRAGRQRVTGDPLKVEVFQLRDWKERYTRKYTAAKERIAGLEARIEDISRTHRDTLKKRDQHMRALEDELARTKELLAARSTELSGAQPFLSTTDCISEAEVLGIVRDLNENIFQVAAKLSEAWEKYEPSKSSDSKSIKERIDSFAQAYGPALIHHALDRDPTAVNFLVQSCLCLLATQLTSSWRGEHDEDLGFVYQHISASEGQAVTARWRTLTHTHLPEMPSQFNLIVQEVGKVLWITGSFSSSQSADDFVKEVASSGIETIHRLSMRLESAFMVDISSSDMYLLFGNPRTDFDDATMTREFESDKSSTRRRKDKVAGTTEVGVEKNVCGKKGEGVRTEVLLRAKVVLEGDLTVL